MWKNPGAEFRSTQQWAAVDNVVHTTSDIFAVLPSRCGKSLLFFLYSLAYPHLVAVLIVPTIALQDDLKHRSEEHGIQCSIDIEFSDQLNKGLVLLTPEAAAGISMRNILVSRQLGRIFIDELHLVRTEGNFRPSFSYLTMLSFLPVPLTLMTATAPIWVTKDICKHFFDKVRCPIVIREPTNRPNISYVVQDKGGVTAVAVKVPGFLQFAVAKRDASFM